MREIGKVVHGGNLREAAKKYGKKPQQFLDFSANINRLPPPKELKKAIEHGVELMKDYPDPDSQVLCQAIANSLEVPIDNIRVGNGSIELLYALLRSLGKRQALILNPTFGEYARAVKICGGDVTYQSLDVANNWKVPWENLIKKIPDVDIVFICNPNNPTGQVIDREELISFIKQAEKNKTLVIVDEAFIDFLEDFNEYNYSVSNLVTSFNYLVVLRSFTKFFAIPGLRLGFCVAAPKWIQAIQDYQEPWTVNCIAQSVGELLVDPSLASYRHQTRVKIHELRKEMTQSLTETHDIINYGGVNFLLLDLKRLGITSVALTDWLAHRGILVRECSSFVGMHQRFIRVAVRTRDENDSFLTELCHVLEEGVQ